MTTMKVYIDVSTHDHNVTWEWALRQVGTRRKVASCEDVCGSEYGARADAHRLAIQRGWVVVEDRYLPPR